MYIGRFLIVTPQIAAYRVSSRSFPHRKIIDRGDAFAVVPTAEADPTDNPYVSYHCLRIGETYATIGNGSHVDPIAEKLDLGYPARDALALTLLTLDYEKDDYQTPRIAAVLSADGAVIGVVREDGIEVVSVDEPTILSTYEFAEPDVTDESWSSAPEAAEEIYSLDFAHPVCAAAVEYSEGGFRTALYNGN